MCNNLRHFLVSEVPDIRHYSSSREFLEDAWGPNCLQPTVRNEHGAAQAISSDQPSTVEIEKLLAVHSEDSLERLFARQIFFAFMKAVGQHEYWKGKAGYLETKVTGDQEWKSLKLSAEVLSKIVSGVRETGFLNQKEAYFDVITPWSLSNALPGRFAAIDHLQKQIHQCILETRDRDVARAQEKEFLAAEFPRPKLFKALESLFILAMTFSNSDSDSVAMYRALAPFQYYTEFLNHRVKTSCKENRRTVVDNWDNDERIHLLKSTKFTLSFAPCSIFQWQLSIWSYLFDWEGRTDSSRAVRVDPSFKLSEYHTWPFYDELKASLHPDIRDWVGLEAFRWTLTHYLSVLGQYFTDTGFPGRDMLIVSASSTSGRCDIFGFTPLHYACATGNVEMVAQLLRGNAPIEVAPWNGISPLHLAAAKGEVETVSLILQKLKKLEMARRGALSKPAAKDTFKDLDGRTAAHWAAMYGNFEIFELLNTDSTITDKYGWNCLHLAIMYENEELTKYLITEAKLDVNTKGTDGRTPLHMAMEKNSTRTIQLLMEFEADIVTADATDEWIFHTAVEYCDLSVVECLINKGADIDTEKAIISRTAAKSCRRNRSLPLHKAAARGHLGITELLLRSYEGREALLLKECHGDTPLHTLAKSPANEDSFAIAKLLAQFLDGNVDPQNLFGDTPLTLAAERGRVDLAAAMIDIGAYESFFLENRRGMTPLEVAQTALRYRNIGHIPLLKSKKDWQGIVSQFEGYEKEARKMMELKAGHPISETSSP